MENSRQVLEIEGKKLATIFGCPFFEVSSKTGPYLQSFLCFNHTKLFFQHIKYLEILE
jgi:hypothetical protein